MKARLWIGLIIVVLLYALLARWALSTVLDEDDRPAPPTVTVSQRDCSLLGQFSDQAGSLPGC